jgi:transcriptional regulator with XRE-family HTH domain
VETESGWDGNAGSAGGARFGAALRALVAARNPEPAAFAAACGLAPDELERVFAGSERVSVSRLAAFASALKLRAIEFLQQTGLLSLEIYAFGLDPLYFLPPGQVRHDARIYMREINPRHAVPERDMLVRNPTLKALLSDEVLDAQGKLEIELAYLLRAAVQQTGGSL